MLSKLQKYGPPNTHDALKFIAITLMVIDHLGAYFFKHEPIFRAFGRASMPIWFFFAGYYKPARFKYEIVFYFFLLGFAGYYFQGHFYSSILISIVIARGAIYLIEKYKWDRISLTYLVAACVIFYLPTILLFQYGSMGILVALCGYLARKKHKPQEHLKNFFIASAMIYIFFQKIAYDFSSLYLAVCILSVSGTFYLLYNYKLKPLKFKNHFAANTIAILGRYSLEVYVLHLLAFIILSSAVK